MRTLCVCVRIVFFLFCNQPDRAFLSDRTRIVAWCIYQQMNLFSYLALKIAFDQTMQHIDRHVLACQRQCGAIDDQQQGFACDRIIYAYSMSQLFKKTVSKEVLIAIIFSSPNSY